MVKIEIGDDSLEYKLESERCRDLRSIFHSMNMACGAFPHAKCILLVILFIKLF